MRRAGHDSNTFRKCFTSYSFDLPSCCVLRPANPQSPCFAFRRSTLTFGDLFMAMSEPARSAWAGYESALAAHPLPVKILTGILGAALGDYIAQRLPHLMRKASAGGAAARGGKRGGTGTNTLADAPAGSGATAAAAPGDLAEPLLADNDRRGADGGSLAPASSSSGSNEEAARGAASKAQPLAAAAAAEAASSGAAGVFKWDVARTARLVAIAALIGSPVGHVWFDTLDRCVMPHNPTAPAAVVTKMLLDQARCIRSCLLASCASLHAVSLLLMVRHVMARNLHRCTDQCQFFVYFTAGSLLHAFSADRLLYAFSNSW